MQRKIKALLILKKKTKVWINFPPKDDGAQKIKKNKAKFFKKLRF